MTEDEQQLIALVNLAINNQLTISEFHDATARWIGKNEWFGADKSAGELWHITWHFLADADERKDPAVNIVYQDNLKNEVDDFIKTRS